MSIEKSKSYVDGISQASKVLTPKGLSLLKKQIGQVEGNLWIAHPSDSKFCLSCPKHVIFSKHDVQQLDSTNHIECQVIVSDGNSRYVIDLSFAENTKMFDKNVYGVYHVDTWQIPLSCENACA